MPFSFFELHGEYIEMRDSRMEELVEYSAKVFPGFIKRRKDSAQLVWLGEAIGKWQNEMVLPPGCKIIRLTETLSSSDKSKILSHFLGFVAAQITSDEPIIGDRICEECKRILALISQTCRVGDRRSNL